MTFQAAEQEAQRVRSRFLLGDHNRLEHSDIPVLLAQLSEQGPVLGANDHQASRPNLVDRIARERRSVSYGIFLFLS